MELNLLQFAGAYFKHSKFQKLHMLRNCSLQKHDSRLKYALFLVPTAATENFSRISHIFVHICHHKLLRNKVHSKPYWDLIVRHQALSSFTRTIRPNSNVVDVRPSVCNFPKYPIINFYSYNNQQPFYVIVSSKDDPLTAKSLSLSLPFIAWSQLWLQKTSGQKESKT